MAVVRNELAQPGSQLANARIAIRDAKQSTWTANILSKQPSDLDGDRLGLATSWPGQDDAIPRRLVTVPLGDTVTYTPSLSDGL